MKVPKTELGSKKGLDLDPYLEIHWGGYWAWMTKKEVWRGEEREFHSLKVLYWGIGWGKSSVCRKVSKTQRVLLMVEKKEFD